MRVRRLSLPVGICTILIAIVFVAFVAPGPLTHAAAIRMARAGTGWGRTPVHSKRPAIACGSIAPGCGISWEIVPSPNDSLDTLYGTAATASNDIWAVGFRETLSGGQTLVEHWNGKQVSIVPSADANQNDYLTSIAAISSTDVWAVGRQATSTSMFGWQTLIEQWNGSSWRIVPSPNAGDPTPTGTLVAVSAVSATDIWAVGSYSEQTSPSTFEDRSLTEHWDGNTWSVIPSANPGSGGVGDDLYGVAAFSANDVWAVGAYDGSNGRTSLIEHWNGSAWSAVAHPAVQTLYAVAAVSTTNVWAVGTTGGGASVEHWNGATWQKVSSPSPRLASSLNAIAVTSATDIWAVGESNVDSSFCTMTEHWNGSSWTVVPSPSTPDDEDFLYGVVAISASDVWAVGGAQSGALIEHIGSLGTGPSSVP